MNATEQAKNDFDILVEAYLDDSLSDEQWEYLAAQAKDDAFQQKWQDALALHTVIGLHHEDEGDIDHLPENKSYNADSRLTPFISIGLIAALSAGGCFITYTLVPKSTDIQPPESLAQDKVILPPKPLAIVLSSSENSLKQGRLITNDTISLDTGWATLQTLNGVSITLEAPFEAKLNSHKDLKLYSGKARVLVPPSSDPFLIKTKHLKVRSSGSDIGIAHNPDGTQRCRVIKGQANVEYINAVGSPVTSEEIISSQSLVSQPSKQDLTHVEETDTDYHNLKFPDRDLLNIPDGYTERIAQLKPQGHWRFEAIKNGGVENSTGPAPALSAIGTANILEETNNNHSGNLNNLSSRELFTLSKAPKLISNDFSFSLFFQVDWLNTFNLVSASSFNDNDRGYSFLLQTYSDFDILGVGTGIRSVYREIPAWEGGSDVYGHRLLVPLRWYNITVTRKNDILSIYLDGQLIGKNQVETGPIKFDELYFGRITSNKKMSRRHAKGLVGRIDELMIFDRALTQEEIKTIQISK